MNIKSCLNNATKALKETPTARLDAEILLAFVLHQSITYLLAYSEKELITAHEQLFLSLIKQRISGMPIAYITGEKDFWTHTLQVNEYTLIPRCDSETLVECVLDHVQKSARKRILDLGTGSGALVIALASELKRCQFVATDRCDKALSIAKKNAEKYQLSIDWRSGDWFEPVANEKFDIIISNPPYIAGNDPHLMQSIRFEPLLALVSEQNGLADLNKIISVASSYLNSQGIIAVEHGYQQDQAVYDLFLANRFTDIKQLKDLSGWNRVTLAKYVVDA